MKVDLHKHPTYPDLYVTEDGRVFRELVGCIDQGGYMLLKVTTGQQVLTLRRHQIVLEAFKGTRPSGSVARHLNGVPSDDSSGNLSWGTQKENAEDTMVHGNTLKGEKNSRAKLTEGNVLDIKARLASGESGGAICQDYGVSWSTICDIKTKRTWGWLK